MLDCVSGYWWTGTEQWVAVSGHLCGELVRQREVSATTLTCLQLNTCIIICISDFYIELKCVCISLTRPGLILVCSYRGK